MMDGKDVAVIVAASITATAAIIGTVATIVNGRITRINEKRLAILKVLLDAAYKEYEFRAKQDIELAKAKGENPRVKVFTEYVIFYRELAELFSKKKVSVNELKASLERNKILIDAYYTNKEIYKPEQHKRDTPRRTQQSLWTKIAALLK